MLGFGDSKTRATRAGGSVDTLIGPQVVLRGDVQFAGGLYLEGQLVGRALAEVGTEATITVAARGRVEGELHAPVIVINGFVKGDVHAFERLELGPEARVEGNLHYAVIEMAAGAAVTGQLVHVLSSAALASSNGAGGKPATSPRTTAEREATPA
ncbi:polymer-forming cytoskeletal protein [Silanimonas sp.]|jgi:cytoskeletal protein CcmA (bactofilin family)|uniref:polymer-forming cytoskeletal protein n=1 Tax=Silanimonas sp. TaxID=1929290 RepID=UPI0037C6C306